MQTEVKKKQPVNGLCTDSKSGKKKKLKLYTKAFATTCDITNKSEHIEKGDTEDYTCLKLTKEVFE